MNEQADQPAPEQENRVLLFVPTRKDAEVTRGLLERGGLRSVTCETLERLSDEIKAGAGAVLLTEEAIASQAVSSLLVVLREQPEWSDLPVVILMRGGAASPKAEAVLRSLTNVTLLERPAPLRSVLSAVQAAVRGRNRQYEILSQLHAIRRAEARARDLQEKLEMAVNASDLGTFYCEMPLGKIVWSERCKAHFGITPEREVDFDLFYSLLHPDDRERTRRAVEACVFEGKPYDVEYRVVSPEGKIRWIRAAGRTSFDAEGKPARFDGTTTDITLRKELEDERAILLGSERAARMEAERANRLKDEFLATLSHELRTPLNAISGWLELLKQEPEVVSTVKEGTDVIARNVKAQTQLIEDLLDMSRITSGKVRLEIRTVELADVIRSAVETVLPAAETKGITIRSALGEGGSIQGDASRLQQVISNLLSNAVKFTPRDGEVRISLVRDGGHMQVTVTDTGEGIEPEFLPHLFERFSQADGSVSRRHGGLGLGLSIVKSLVEMHGGAVVAESAGRGSGATFRVTLPLHSGATSADPEGENRTVAQGAMNCGTTTHLNGARVLVVDDESDSRQVLSRLILAHGGSPKVASSAEEAEPMLAAFQPQVIVSDIGMPGIDGYSFIREIRRHGITTPAVALTAFARPEDRRRAVDAGFQRHLSKPVEPAELMSVIAALAR